MKRITTLFLCLLLLSALALTVHAAGYMQLSSSSGTLYRGDSFTITVTLSNDQPVSNGGVILSYDTAALEMLGGSCQVSNAAFSNVSASIPGGTFVMESDAVVSGTIFTFRMRVKDTAPFGSYSISGDASLNIGCSLGGTSVTVACKHDYKNCTEKDSGSHQSTCTICGDVKTESHSWNSGTVTKAPTCTATGTKKLTCTGCGATKTDTVSKTAHAYKGQSLDSETHRLTCRDCGHQTTGNHSLDKWSHDSNWHQQLCSACDYQTEQAAHSPGPKATETTDQLCTVCQRILQPKGEHVHSFSESWSTDDTGHWHSCSDCNEKDSAAPHSFADDCDGLCDTCGFTRQSKHAPESTWSCDETDHWYACTACGEKLELSAHTPGPEATVTSPQTCTQCGFTLAPVLPHDHIFDADGTTHRHTCPCGEVYETTAEDCRVCAGFPWMWVCIAEAVLFLLILGFLCWRCRKPKEA